MKDKKIQSKGFHWKGSSLSTRTFFSTFPIIEREERAVYGGKYRSRELCLAYMNALAAGNPDAEIRL